MNYKITGLTSLGLMFLAIGIAVYQLMIYSVILGIAYLICMPVAFLVLLYNYCRKCPHTANDTCRHVIFGKITKLCFGVADPSEYSNRELILAFTPLIIFIIFPQYWLFRNIFLFIVFWILMLLALVIVRRGVCPDCKHMNCPLHTNAKTK